MAKLGGIDRRSLLQGRLTTEPFAPRPPGSTSESIRSACTGCAKCAEACPRQIIRLDRNDRATVDFTDSECTFCGVCAEVCPEPVFERSAGSDFAHVMMIGGDCFAARGIVCQSCGDACPESAIRFSLRLGGPPLPFLDPERCSGCGACIAACPAGAVTTSAREVEACHG